MDWSQPYLLAAEDPCFPDNDISRCSFAIMEVRDVFNYAYMLLTCPGTVNELTLLFVRG
jgi:DNA polymerase sigma